MGNSIGGNILVYLAGNGQNGDCGKLRIVDDTLPVQLRDAGISNEDWAAFVLKAQESIGTAQNPCCFMTIYIIAMTVGVHGFVFGSIHMGLFDSGGAAFMVIFHVIVIGMVMLPLAIFFYFAKQRQEEISKKLKAHCTEMCRRNNVGVECGFFGGQKHQQACIWFKVTQASKQPRDVELGKTAGEPVGGKTATQKLEELTGMRNQGLIDEGEFAAKKAEILATM
jgi:hypothetical protein